MKISPTLIAENILWHKGFTNVVGLDEAGRGPLAGPLVAAAVILPRDFVVHPYLRDSKLVTPKRRELLFTELTTYVKYGLGEVSNLEVDELGIRAANELAFLRACDALREPIDFYLIDHFTLKPISNARQRGITKGDRTVASIAAASIIAKVTRDSIMLKMHKQYPQYGFDKHKGYGTNFHCQAIQRHGVSPIHRITFLGNII